MDGHHGIGNFWRDFQVKEASWKELSPPTTPTHTVGVPGPSQATWDRRSLGPENGALNQTSDDDDGEFGGAQVKYRPHSQTGWDIEDSMPADGDRWSEEGRNVDQEIVVNDDGQDDAVEDEEEEIEVNDDGQDITGESEEDDEVWFESEYVLHEEEAAEEEVIWDAGAGGVQELT